MRSFQCGKEVPYEVSGRALTCEGEVHPICQAMINLEAELNEKNQSICRMEERLSVKECEIKKLQEQLFALEEDCHSKNQQVRNKYKYRCILRYICNR